MKTLILFGLLIAARASASPPDRKQVIDLMRIVMPKSSYTAMIDQLSAQAFEQMKQSGQNVQPGDAQRVRDAVLEAIPYEENIGWAADVYQEKFTAQEIADLRKFYETPTGKKAVRLLPEIAGEVGRRLGQIIPTRLPAALKKHGIAPKSQ